MFLTLGAAEEETGDGFARQERVRLRYLKQTIEQRFNKIDLQKTGMRVEVQICAQIPDDYY